MIPTALTIRDLERLQGDRPDLRMELVNGEIRIMSPSGYESSEICLELGATIGKKTMLATSPALTIQDLQQLQADRPDFPMELVNGEIRVMSPSGFESGEVSGNVLYYLKGWVLARRLGRVADSSTGFVLPNKTKDVRAPDVSFVRADRLRQSPTSYAELAPDLIVEVKSPTDSLVQLREKVRSFLEVGTQVGILVDPRKRIVEIYRPGQETPQVLQDGDVLTVPDLLPGWSVAIADLWPLVF